MRKLSSGLAILLVAASPACNNMKESQATGTAQSSKDEGSKGNPANTPAGGSNTSTGNNAVDKQNQPTSSPAASGGTSDNGANPSTNDPTRPHARKTNDGKSAATPTN